MENARLEFYWHDIPIGKDNAVSYKELCARWDRNERAVRVILHDLSRYDNGDDFILIRSSAGRGFYRTDDLETIKAYKRECLNRGRNVFAPVRKINKVLGADPNQFSFFEMPEFTEWTNEQLH